MSYSIPNNGGDISRAIAFVLGLKSMGGTNINDALLQALEIAERVKTQEEIASKTEQLIIFLSDGQPSYGSVNQTRFVALLYCNIIRMRSAEIVQNI